MDSESYCYKSISGPNETLFKISSVFTACFMPSLGQYSPYHIEKESSEALCDLLLTIKETKPRKQVRSSVSHDLFFSSSLTP